MSQSSTFRASAALLALLLAACSPAQNTPNPTPPKPSASTGPQASATPGPGTASPAPGASATPVADFALALPEGLDAARPLRIEAVTGAELAQKRSNDAWSKECENPTVVTSVADGQVIVNGKHMTRAEFETFTQTCASRKAAEVKTVTPIVLDLPLSSGQRSFELPRDRFPAGSEVQLRLQAQPSGTCFRVQSDLSYTPGTASAAAQALANRAVWTPIDSQGRFTNASGCIHGSVKNLQDGPLANALVLVGGTRTAGAPTLVKTNAQGQFLVDGSAFSGVESATGLELHVGSENYRPKRQALRYAANGDWTAARNRFDFKLDPADNSLTQSVFTLLLSQASALDPDYTQQMKLLALNSDTLAEISPPELELSVTHTQLTAGKEFVNRKLKASQPYKLSLTDTSCAPRSYGYFGLLDHENRLDVKDWTGVKAGNACFESFPLRVSVSDTTGLALAGVQVEYSFSEFNPGNLQGNEAPRGSRSSATDSAGNLLTTLIPLYVNNQNVVTLRFIKAGYAIKTETYTVKKPNGDASANQLKVVLSKTL